MELNSFVVRVEDLLKLSAIKEYDGIKYEQFDKGITSYVIPAYQREYQWSDSRIEDLIMDINNRSKFLGHLILDKVTPSYELIDGQQRITTIIMILVSMFNRLKRKGPHIGNEQQRVLNCIFRDHQFVLKNDSIGQWLTLNGNLIELTIDEGEDIDIYGQRPQFLHAFEYISTKLDDLDAKQDFLAKLLDSKILLLICSERTNEDFAEQIFLDMNFKLEILDSEAIFKGYCFRNYYSEQHSELKKVWVNIKRYSQTFRTWGYKSFNDFLYHFMLCQEGYSEIKKDLKINGRHCLDGKDCDDTKDILDKMSLFSYNLHSFAKKLNTIDYKLEDLCPDIKNYTTTEQPEILKQMCRIILEHGTAQYYKFPFMELINILYQYPSIGSQLDYKQFRKLITNYFIYSVLFLSSSKEKSKKDIDRTIFDILNTAPDIATTDVVVAVQNLRKSWLTDYAIFESFNTDYACFLYSVIDYYNANDNFVPCLYSITDGYNREHLIIHKKKGNAVRWNGEAVSFEFSLSDICADTSKLMRKTANGLILEKELNGSLEHDDIITKIQRIENYYHASAIPNHIKVFLDNIKSLKSFKQLCDMKKSTEESEIKNAYKLFVEEYFSTENQEQLLLKLGNALRKQFQN